MSVGRFLREVNEHIFLTGFYDFMVKCSHDGIMAHWFVGCTTVSEE